MQIYQIIKQIISLLKYLHKKSISHGSLCPENILVTRQKLSNNNQN
jgi:serine/threonine protein kinase